MFLRQVIFRGTLITLAVSAVITILEDDALEKWCKRTLYRGSKYENETPFEDGGKELAALYGAIAEVI